jgi:hypothetical protein
MAKLRRLFHAVSTPNLLKNIEPSENLLAKLDSAKATIRTALRHGMPIVLQKLRASTMTYIPETYTRPNYLQPKFFTQGSRAYGTLNQPCQTPPQQADVDDGVYLPLDFLQGQTRRPNVASQAFFAAVEAVLTPVAKLNNWRLIQKPTCVRVEVDPAGHLDLPLYAIPRSDFITLTEARVQKALGLTLDRQRMLSWDDLPEGSVFLAHRQLDWEASDPRPTDRWVRKQRDVTDGQFIRLTRYLKAWRDNQYRDGGPCSILLMTALAETLELRDHDDDALLATLEQGLIDVLQGEVRHPISGKRLDVELDEKRIRSGLIGKIHGLARDLKTAIDERTVGVQALALMQTQFGPRFPSDVTLLMSAPAVVASHKAEYRPERPVGRMQSG